MKRLGWLTILIMMALIAGCAGATPSEADRALAAASMQDEEGTEHGHGHEHGHAGSEMVIPTIDPVSLGEGERLKVVVTSNILGDVVSNVGGDNIDLTVLIGLGQDPHSYQATARDLVAIEEAHLVFVVGLNLEESLMSTIEATSIGPVVPASAGIEPIGFAGHEHEEEEEHSHSSEEHEHSHDLDPHFWLDPNNVIVWTRNIADALSAADLAHADEYAANAARYIAQLEELDADIREQVALIPPENRKLITDHMAFGYFADEYGFEQIGAVIPSTTTTTESSAGDIAKLVDQMRQEGVATIFVGTSASNRLQQLAEMIAQEAGSNVRVLSVYVGSLDAPGTPGDTYIGMMRYNIAQIVEGLAP